MALIVHLEPADRPDPEAQPGVDAIEERVALRLQSNRGKPQLIGRGVGDPAVRATPDPSVIAPSGTT
jgi:hypothetical protein